MTGVNLSSIGTATRILIVDDEPLLADLLKEWVDEKWTGEVAYGGEAALELLNKSIDVVLLDRQMPDVPGEEVLERIRDNFTETQVLVVSSVIPDYDVIGMPFDSYLQKPVNRPEVQGAIEQLLVRRNYRSEIQKFFAAMAKIDLLEASKPASELAEDERYLALKARADELRQQADATLGRPTDHVREMYDSEADD